MMLNFFKIILLHLSLFLLSAELNGQVDSFSVEGRIFRISNQDNWIPERSENGLANDSVWNFVMRYIIDKKELNARIGVQIVQTAQPGKSKKRSKKTQYTFAQMQYGEVKGLEITFNPALVKNCRICGYNYSTVYAVPLSDCRTLYIVFFGNGSKNAMDSIQPAFRTFCSNFCIQNANAIKDYYLPNGLPSQNCYSTFNVLNGFNVRLEFDTTWLVMIDTITDNIQLQQYYSCKDNATIFLTFDQVINKSPAPKTQFNMPGEKKQQLLFPINKSSLTPSSPLAEATLPREHWAITNIYQASWFTESEFYDEDVFWEDIVVSASHHIYHPDLPNSSVTVTLYVHIEDPIYELYYENVVNAFLSQFLRQNKFLNEQYPDSNGIIKLTDMNIDPSASLIQVLYVTTPKQSSGTSASPADKPKPTPSWRRL